ncbi:hypothetical protein BDK51DRAFT_45759 [Blyttiomyces helicus]|uniref:Copine C-terminal domain-containing protein n=1 Tax=Blyttiomyces helicus TaxID=388810 RepID=A0A4P9WKY4_9FUNG|nr:hypothetical protein BDK51DRAFT_45759 [Blyttiomyces helicus]|eukprot:RKO92703.1 hypothetical protein BDK51DRAFT_45759 [Blyttiomyces helicus]
MPRVSPTLLEEIQLPLGLLLLLLLYINFSKVMGFLKWLTSSNHDSSAKRDFFERISDKFTSLDQVTAALRKAGLESSQLIIGIDYTKSNEWTGAKTFGGRSLHAIQPGSINPYQSVISILGRTLGAL